MLCDHRSCAKPPHFNCFRRLPSWSPTACCHLYVLHWLHNISVVDDQPRSWTPACGEQKPVGAMLAIGVFQHWRTCIPNHTSKSKLMQEVSVAMLRIAPWTVADVPMHDCLAIKPCPAAVSLCAHHNETLLCGRFLTGQPGQLAQVCNPEEPPKAFTQNFDDMLDTQQAKGGVLSLPMDSVMVWTPCKNKTTRNTLLTQFCLAPKHAFINVDIRFTSKCYFSCWPLGMQAK